ncbi:MAG: hypothetical protein SO132_06290 [Candidatus Enteromonas sp.]|nr:hypothetical protein [Candidatus Enteromonas sp.]
MNKKSFSLFLLSLLLASCKQELSSSSSKNNSSELSSNDSSLLNTSTSEIESTESSLTSSEPISSGEQSSISLSSSSSNIDNIPEVSGNNPDGSKRIDVPSNYNDPFDYSGDYYTFDTSEYSYSSPIKGGFSLIYGNSKYDKPSASKYEYNEDNPDINGLKMDYFDKYYNGKSQVGIQSPCLVSNKKIEFRFKVSASHGTQRKNPKKDKPLFTIYSFSKAAELIKTDTYFGDKYCSAILNNGEVKIYITPADNVSYFEFRLNQAPYKNNQEFNFNIFKLTIRQWEFE